MSRKPKKNRVKRDKKGRFLSPEHAEAAHYQHAEDHIQDYTPDVGTPIYGEYQDPLDEIPADDDKKSPVETSDDDGSGSDIEKIINEIDKELGIVKSEKKVPFWLKVVMVVGGLYILKKMFD
jgi:hypothetical protein